MTDEQLEKLDEDKKVAFSPKKWARILSYMGEFKKLLIVMIIFTVILVVNDVLFPLLQSYLIDNFIEKQRTEGIWIFAAVYLFFILFQTTVVIIFLRFCLKLELGILRVLRNRIFKKFQEFDVGYFNNRSVGYLVAKTMSDTERIGNTISWGLLDIGYNLLYILGVFVPMFIINYKIALIIMLIIPLSLFVSMMFEKRLLKMNRKIRTLNSSIAGSINEGIVGAKTIKSLNAEDTMTGEFGIKTKEMCYESFKYHRINSLYVAILIWLGAFGTAAVLSLGGIEVSVYGMKIGELAAFVTYSSSLINPVMQLAETLTNMIANQANVERTISILDKEPRIVDSPEVIEKYGDAFHPKYENWEAMEGEIEFKNVSFKYEGSDRYILKDFNLKIPKGSSVALVGETGAGKTTIVNLICRFYEPTEGQILIDGVDYRERSQLWLFSHLGYVLQSPHLFSGTIKDNIKYANEKATDEQVIEASKLVSLDRIVERLPKAYDSQIGECGDTLSTGEKQLITFARALLADPKIVILDEATSSVDTETEHLIQHAIHEVLNQRTSITIAHRLSTIKNADNILLIENGTIIESGTHNNLMKQRGKYHNLYTKLFELENSLKM